MRVLVVLLLLLPAVAQTSTREDEERQRLLERAQSYTAEVLEKDDWKLPEHYRPILRARLAEIWWKQDPQRARGWLDEAVEGVLSVPQNESEEQRLKRLGAANVVMKVASQLDRAASDRVLREIATSLKPVVNEMRREGHEGLRSRYGQQLMLFESALDSSIAELDEKADPEGKRMYELLLAGVDVHIASFHFSALARRNRGLADKLFDKSIAAARADFEPVFIANLGEQVFSSFPSDYDFKPSEEQRNAYLQVIVDGLERTAENDAQRAEICQLAPLASRMMRNLGEELRPRVEARIVECKPFLNPSGKGEVDRARPDLKTSDDYLAAADAEQDLKKRAELKIRAAILARQTEHNVQRGYEILRRMSPEERDVSRQFFDSTWGIHAFEVIEALYKAKDFAGTQNILDESPDSQRGYLLFTITSRLFGDKNETAPAFLRSLLEEVRARQQNPRIYLGTMNLFLLHAPAQASEVAKICIAEMNRMEHRPPWEWSDAERQEARKKNVVWSAPVGFQLEGMFSNSWKDFDDGYARALISMFEDPADRAAMRLSMSRALLAKYQEAAPRKPAPLPPKAKPAPAATPQPAPPR